MYKTTASASLVKTPAAAPRQPDGEDHEMTDRTAAELREICAEMGVEYDRALTEAQARRRIDALKSR